MDKVRTILDRALKIIFISALLYIVFPFFKYFLWDIDNFWLSSGNRLPLEKIASIQKVVKNTEDKEAFKVYKERMQDYVKDSFVWDTTRYQYNNLDVWGKLKTKDGLYVCEDDAHVSKSTVSYVYLTCGVFDISDISDKYYVSFYDYGGKWYDQRRHHYIIKVYERSTFRLVKTIVINARLWHYRFNVPQIVFIHKQDIYIYCNHTKADRKAIYKDVFCKFSL